MGKSAARILVGEASELGATWPWLERLGDVCPVRASDLRLVVRTHLRRLGFDVPHAEAYVIERAELVRIVEREGLFVDLPEAADPVLLVAVPPTNERAVLEDWVVERRVLAATIHARVEGELEALRAAGELDDDRAAALLGRLEPASVRESRRVLESVDRLGDTSGPLDLLIELVATVCELQHTTDGQLALWLPAADLANLQGVTSALGVDLSAAQLVGSAGAARARELARRPGPERASGNLLARRPDRAAALEALAGQLAGVLPELGWRPDKWLDAIGGLAAEPRDARQARAQRRTRRHLWQVVRAAEQPGLELKPFSWLLSGTQAPLFERLEAQVGVHKHRALRRARRQARSAGAAAQAVVSRLDMALSGLGRHLRDALGPTIAVCLHQAGLVATSVPERVAAESVVAQLLDQLLDHDYIGFANLRDAVSVNQLKLPDTTLRTLWSGDALLVADRRLNVSLSGVYRKSTIYMRLIKRLSALFFGTGVGRRLTRFVLVPFVAAFVALEGLQHLVGPLMSWAGLPGVALVSYGSVGAVGLLVALLVNHPGSRALARRGLVAVGRAVSWLFLELPRRLLANPLLRALFANYATAVLRRFVIRPLSVVGVLWLIARAYEIDALIPWMVWVALFVLVGAALSTRYVRRLQVDVSDTLGGWWGQLTRRWLPDLFHAIARTSRRLLDAVDKLAHRVEEALRIRSHHSKPAKVVRAVAGRVWAVFAYVIRLYVTLLIEPQINPVKHFPVVTVSHKLMLPMLPQITRALEGAVSPLIGVAAARAFAWTNVFLLPGLFGFLVWELSSNWRLYAANRPSTLRPVRIGHHGEDLPHLLRPGFRSGAIPKSVERMRKEAAETWARGERPDLVDERRELSIIEERVGDFFRRELAALLHHTGALRGQPAVQIVQHGRYRLGVLLTIPGQPPLALWLEDREDRLFATLRSPGFARDCDDEGRAVVADALLGVFRMADVLVLELPGPSPAAWRAVSVGAEIVWSDWVSRWSASSGQARPGQWAAHEVLSSALRGGEA